MNNERYAKTLGGEHVKAGASSIFHVLAAQCLCVPFIIHVEIS